MAETTTTVEATSTNYPYDQNNWFESTQEYCCKMSRYGFLSTDPKYRYIVEQGKCAYIPGTTKRIYQQEFEDYKKNLSPTL
jgi:hypothetical protein